MLVNAAETSALRRTLVAVLGPRALVACDLVDANLEERLKRVSCTDDLRTQLVVLVTDVLRHCLVSSAIATTQTDLWTANPADALKAPECKDLVALDLATPLAKDSDLPLQTPLPMPTCVGCNLDTKMKCIWLSEREQEAFKHHPWMCLKCAVRNPIESIVPGMMDRNANMCIWFNQVTRLKAKYTEFKLIPNEDQEAVEDAVNVQDEGQTTQLPMIERDPDEQRESRKGVKFDGDARVLHLTHAPIVAYLCYPGCRR